ncbi:hypothetical protein Salat_1140700 [Sesamum alatum]|uniref:Uncharacterized protein n=1 Tax=Sesamum alatum TaxID=300844 RepID=A0AAE1YDS5_9LAMI|nr:hypothetical protein Salat_1140700 [Sesamum alatum]
MYIIEGSHRRRHPPASCRRRPTAPTSLSELSHSPSPSPRRHNPSPQAQASCVGTLPSPRRRIPPPNLGRRKPSPSPKPRLSPPPPSQLAPSQPFPLPPHTKPKPSQPLPLKPTPSPSPSLPPNPRLRNPSPPTPTPSPPLLVPFPTPGALTLPQLVAPARLGWGGGEGKMPEMGINPPPREVSAKLHPAAADIASNMVTGADKQVNGGSTLQTNRDARQGHSPGAAGSATHSESNTESMPSLETIEEAREHSVHFANPVTRNWSYPTAVVGMARLAAKLKRLKHRLKEWNKSVFGDIFLRLKEAEELVKWAERTYDEAPTEANLFAMKRATAEWPMALSIEEGYWKQKSSCKWVLGGDQNTRFFHSMVRKSMPGLLFLPSQRGTIGLLIRGR